MTQLTFATDPNNYIQPHSDPDQNSIVLTNAPLPNLGLGSIYTMNSDGTGITCVIGSVAAPGQSTCNVVSSANNETPGWQPEQR